MPQPTTAQLGAAIRRLRLSRGQSIEALAAEANMHWTSISRIEKGKQSPTWNAVSVLATALDVGIADLARLAGEQPNSND